MKLRAMSLLLGTSLFFGVSTSFGVALAQGTFQAAPDARYGGQGQAGTLGAAGVVQIPPCQVAGQSVTADVGTDTGKWKVTGPSGTGGPVPATLSAWTALSAAWIQPTGPGGTLTSYGTAYDYRSGVMATADFTYRISFYLPCTPSDYSALTLSGVWAADNSATSANLNGHASTSAPPPIGFTTPTAFSFSQTNFVQGNNTLTVVVHNVNHYTGLAVQAKVAAQCGKMCCRTLPSRYNPN